MVVKKANGGRRCPATGLVQSIVCIMDRTVLSELIDQERQPRQHQRKLDIGMAESILECGQKLACMERLTQQQME